MITNTFVADVKDSFSTIKEEYVTYMTGDIECKGFLAYDQSIKGKRPAILVASEWWGIIDNTKVRVRQLAELGYIALVIDFYGDGKIAVNPRDAQTLTTPFYNNPHLGKKFLDAALKKIKEYPQTDQRNIAAIGYGFGGFVVLNSAKLGADLKGVISFHGNLTGLPVDKTLLKAKILVCYGTNDKFVPQREVDALKQQLDSVGAISIFKAYPNTMHAFTNPESTKMGKEFKLPIEYNAEADKNSWNDMKTFFAGLFK